MTFPNKSRITYDLFSYLCSVLPFISDHHMLPIESLNLQMLNVGLARHNGDWNWQNVSSPFTRIYLCTEGAARLHMPDERVDLRPGYLYLVPAYTRHSYECHGKFTHYYLHLYEGFKKESDIFDLYDFPIEVKAEGYESHIFANICKTHPDAKLPASNPTAYDNMTKFIGYVHRYNQMPLYQKLELRGSILILFSHFVKHAKPKMWTEDKRLEASLKYIHENIYTEINIDDLASIACMSKTYFIRYFAKTFGMPPLQYINRKKVERAQLLLLTEEKPVKEIAYSVGYNDHSYFIRLFKKITGMTPMAYRQTMS